MARPDPADPLAALAARARQTRKPVPRGLWIAAAIVIAITAIAAVSVAIGGAAQRPSHSSRSSP